MRNSEKDPDPPTDDLCWNCKKELQDSHDGLCKDCRYNMQPIDVGDDEG